MLGIVVAYLLLLFTLFSIPSLADTGNELPTRSTSSAQDLVESLNRRSPLGLPKLAREAKARGLPTIAPSLRQMKDRADRSTLQPNTPKVTVKGLLWCDFANGTELGWLLPDREIGVYGRFTTFKHSWGSALKFLELEFSYDPTAGPNVVREEFEITTPLETAPAYGYFGAVKGYASDTPDLGTDPTAYSMVTSTVSYGPGAVPTNGSNTWSDSTAIVAQVEAAIWTYLPATKEIGAKWVNTDHSRVPLEIWVGPFNDLYLGWNVTAYNLHSFLPDYMKVVKCRIDDAFVPWNPDAP